MVLRKWLFTRKSNNMNIKIFKHWDEDALETDISKWLSQNKNIKIIKMLQTSSINPQISGGTMYTIISIVYKVKSIKFDTGPRQPIEEPVA